ncbi:MAG: ZIP family metal transporter [Candidatus Sericytochromatia bacterium]
MLHMDSLIYGLVTASTTMAGGLWIASRPRTWATQSRLAAMMSVGAGLLLAVVAFELLPVSVAHGGHHAFSAVFAGVLAVLLFERYLAPRLTFLNPKVVDDHGHAHHDHDHAHDHDHSHDHDPGHLLSHGAACSALGCLLVCTFFDGMAMVAGFHVSAQVGFLVALGLIAHMLPEGVLASTVVLASGNSAKLARRAAIATGVAFLLGMLVPMVVGNAFGLMTLVLPFTAGVLLYVVLGQLMPVALRSASGVPLVIAGALVFGIVERLLPHAH